MILILDLDRTLNRLYPPWTRSIRDLVPPVLASRDRRQMWEWIGAHLAENKYPVHDGAVRVVQALSERASRVIVNTGRPEMILDDTREWLRNYFRVDQLLMRAGGDFRRTIEIKREHLTVDILPAFPGETIYAFDDNQETVQMYRRHGAIGLLAPECWTAIAKAAVSERDILRLLCDLQGYPVLPNDHA